MAQPTTPAPQTQVAKLRQFQEQTVNKVLSQVKEFQEMGALDLPSDYSPANALKAAWFTLLNTKDRNDKPVLESCDNTSVVNALMEMVTQGLNPAKKQCSFIAYGRTLQMQREYFGSIALAKRYNPEIADVSGNVIFKDDVFKYKIDPATGRKVLIDHEQVIENMDKPIIGAYATIVFNDGSSHIEPMTMQMIRNAWNQGAMKGNSPAHKNFPDQMSIKTAINRACKPFINASDDSEVTRTITSSDQIPETANSKLMDIEDSEADEVKDEPVEKPEKKEVAEDLTPMKVKNLDEARKFLHDDLGVHSADLIRDKVHEAAKANGFKIEVFVAPEETDPGF